MDELSELKTELKICAEQWQEQYDTYFKMNDRVLVLEKEMQDLRKAVKWGRIWLIILTVGELLIAINNWYMF